MNNKILMYIYLALGIVMLTVSAASLVYIYTSAKTFPPTLQGLNWIFVFCGAAWIALYFRMKKDQKQK